MATIAGAALVVTLAAVPAQAAPAHQGRGPSSDSASGSTDINGYRSVGYFQAFAPGDDGRDYEVADILRSGAIEDLTHINYAFGNVTTDLVCDIVDEPGEGDPENDYTRLVSKADSVDGKADKANQKLAGNFNQLRKLKKVSPDTKILISLGGWTWSDNFSDAAATPESRERLVSSCIDLYIKGNLPEHDGFGGKKAARGVFDGIDIDWEWPAADGEQPSPRPDEDKANFLALLQEFRTQLDAYGHKTHEDYLLTGFAPAGWAPRTNGGWVDPIAVESFDFLNVQGYDYHGGWVPDRAGHQGNLHPYTWPDANGDEVTANWGLAADGLMDAYRAAGYSGEQLNLGMAAYGQGWEGCRTAPGRVPRRPALSGPRPTTSSRVSVTPTSTPLPGRPGAGTATSGGATTTPLRWTPRPSGSRATGTAAPCGGTSPATATTTSPVSSATRSGRRRQGRAPRRPARTPGSRGSGAPDRPV
ncbi:hypothetical protein GCM10025865_17920 [Paraoerskovia sediminicola]|uniref:chitinase n=1 Tax=Paraoerskovia sediminicola TaxID=1138587 RepID=A0ABN6XBY6_9CELL|nr:glycosyl hydrolase family 18 protein [Paraoerskovia sediminicola]BDZ42493.1 hypothetical protein GCM10025865_17920 [Paraoerskovia sediminicola]